MKKMKKSKGFTLAELLIVVAIMAILVGVAIPVFTSQMNNAKYGVDQANARSLYAEFMSDYLANGNKQSADYKDQTISGKTTVKTPSNTYDFSGIVGIDIKAGTATKAPSVTVNKYGAHEAITFGGASVS